MLQNTVGYNFTVLQNITLDELEITATQIILKNASSGYLNNTNLTGTGNLSLVGNNLLCYNSTGSICTGSSSNINSNDGEINTSYSYGQDAFALDNYYVEEGVTRANDPISISGTSKSKHIASTLSDRINATVIISIGNYKCENVNQITYTPNGGTTITYNGNQARSVCTSLTTTGYVLQLNPSLTSNELELSFSTTPIQTTILKLLIGILMIGVLIFSISIFYITVQNNFENLTVSDITKYSITLLIVVTLTIVLANYIATLV